MKITFFNAQKINKNRDGFDFEFFYTVNEKENIHKIHVVTKSDGAELAWHISPQDLNEYSKKAFSLVVDFIKTYWKKHHELPDESREYFEGRELQMLRKDKVSWENYVLELE